MTGRSSLSSFKVVYLLRNIPGSGRYFQTHEHIDDPDETHYVSKKKVMNMGKGFTGRITRMHNIHV